MQPNAVFPNLSSVEKAEKQFFILRGPLAYENFNRAEVDSGQRNSVTAN
jgi:hypothetical protein